MMQFKAPGIWNCGLAVLAFGALGACSSQPSEYAWSHLESGEYLFAFDTQACETSSRNLGPEGAALAQSVKGSPAFFSCMQKLGYFLVDPLTGERLAAAGAATVSLVDVSEVRASR